MKKKNRNEKRPETTLKKAEKLFKKGNYLSAKKEFDEIYKYLKDDDIAEKIQICEREILQFELRELIKRGRKCVKKGNLKEAIRCFEDAHKISDEPWLPERIQELRQELAGRASFEAAKNAEISGDYEKAAKLYEETLATRECEDLLLKKASSLVKAEKYDEAIAIFSGVRLSDDRDRYDYGFALAKMHRYHDCLNIWDAVQSMRKTFHEQKQLVRSLLAADLYDRFCQLAAHGSDSATQDNEAAAIYEQGAYLIKNWKQGTLSRAPKDSDDGVVQGLVSGVAEYCKYAWIDQLWKAEQYETIGELLLPYPTEMNTDLLTLYAKTFFRLAETSEKYVPDLTVFWLTALYHPKIFETLSATPDERAAAREMLIQKAEDLIKKYADSGNNVSKNAWGCWNVEKQVMKDINALVDHQNFGSEPGAIPVCTPRFAEKFKLSGHVIDLIRNNQDFFSDKEHYLITGGYYSSAGQSLFHLENEAYKEALASLPRPGASKEAGFVAYCIERVHFGYGLWSLEKGEARSTRYFENAADLFEKSPGYEKMFSDKAIACHDVDEMGQYENALNEIHSKRPTQTIKETLSLVMVRRAIKLYNKRQMNIKAVEAKIAKALALNPENELARSASKRMQIETEMDEFLKAIDKFKMNKVCQIAAKSEHPEIKKEFFIFMEHNVEHLDDMDIDDHEKIILLNDFFKWCARVDEKHPLLYDIDSMLKELE